MTPGLRLLQTEVSFPHRAEDDGRPTNGCFGEATTALPASGLGRNLPPGSVGKTVVFWTPECSMPAFSEKL
jgi:hypothetical protein